ncbi:fibronectin type III domain-containing protein [Winogradskyella ursingii]|uniref:fibronectin type III domain-containing protein n=1 Tax=Winogradskyella ursingii TaxID=2686079 RepID=UPI0015C7A694|nr:fibronectin type III domain-containing protein [Winogradskyella ursingii]
MKFKTILIFLFLATFLFGFGNTDKYRLILRSDPATTATVGWNQISGNDPILYYGTTDFGTTVGSYPFSKNVDRSLIYKGMNNQFVRLTGLTPNTNYYFVIADSEGTSQRFWFRTAPDDNSRLSFIAGGDSRNNRLPRQDANLLVSKLKPHAVFFGGDMTDTNSESEWREWFDDWQLTIASDGRMFPIVAARGNHETDDNTIYNLFDSPNVTGASNTDTYFAITFGDDLIRAYTLDTNISVLGNQKTWLENDLQASSQITWKMAQYHRPMRSHNSLKSDDNRIYTAWANLFYDYGVKLVVDSDSHMTKTTWPVKPSFEPGNDLGFVIDKNNGTVYAGEGSWGAPLRPDDRLKSWTRNSGTFNQFKLIFVEPSMMELRTINVSNASEVTEVSNTDPFTLPTNLNIFSPPTGSVVTISNAALASCPPEGAPCDDNDPTTVYDEEDGACNCIGIEENSLTLKTTRVSVDSDDAEEFVATGVVEIGSSDLELINDNGNDQLVGIRFDNIDIIEGATILRAYIQFQTDETDSILDPTNLVIRGELAPNSNTFANNSHNISSRTLTNASINWDDVGKWGKQNFSEYSQQTPRITNIVNEIYSQPGWISGNSMTFIISGTGRRVADARESGASIAPRLLLFYDRNCPINSIVPSVQSSCDDFDDTYSQDLIIEYSNAPTNGTLIVNNQSFPIGTSPQTITLTGLTADGLDVNVNAYFSENPICNFSEDTLFEAPSKCSLGGIPDNYADDNINLALLSEAIVSGSVSDGRGTPETILYDPDIGEYHIITDYNEYGVGFEENIGTPNINDAFEWRVNWPNVKYINYLTIGGSYSNQDQSQTIWRISYRRDGIWNILEEGQGGWLDNGIYQWGGPSTNPIEADAIRVQLYSDGQNNVVSVHLRGRGADSNIEKDSSTTPKATLIQYLSPGNSCNVNVPENAMLYCSGEWIYGDGPTETTGLKDILVGDGTYIVTEDSEIIVNHIEIASGASLIIEKGASLTVNGNLTNNGSLELQSNSTKYSSLIVNGTSSGEVRYKRHVNAYNGTTGNDLIVPPVTGQTFGDFNMANPNLFANPSNPDQKLFGPFNESSGNYQTYFASTDSGATLDKGVGYRAARDTSKDGANGTTLEFSGNVETTSFSIPITESQSSFSGWNLIGNPYPSYMDFETFFNLNKDELDAGALKAVYGYDGDATNGWTILNNVTSGVLIAPGQGFFVKTKSGGGTINFTPAMRVKGNTDDFITGRNNLGLVKIEIANSSDTFETDIYFNTNASRGLDLGYDASLFGGSAPDFSVYTMLVEENTGIPMGIQAIGENDMNAVVIPLGINAIQGQTVSVSLSQMSIPSYVDIYLEDREKNNFTLLHDDSYNFTAEENISKPGRFFIHFESQVLSTTEEELNDLIIYTNQLDKSIIIEGQLSDKSIFTIYDINGRVLRTKDLNAFETKQIIEVNNLSSGIYIVQINNGINEKRIQKIVLE